MSGKTVLIVDDEPDIRELLEITLGRMDLETYAAADLAQAKAILETSSVDLCLTDMRLPDGNGISLVEHLQANHPEVPVAVITAHGSVDAAIRALKAGAFDFISKPVALDALRALVQDALAAGAGSASCARPSAGQRTLVGRSERMRLLRTRIDKLARSQAPVHVHGESGTGKEVVARLIHERGPRAGGPFVAVNCGAIPEELLESELFGHVRGSFTGADRDKPGLFQAAEGGTLFLDEVADLPLSMQVKLLRAIQEKSVRPVGASSETPTNVRLLSATHKHLAREVEEGRFRADLYFRIHVIELEVPPLRERSEDLEELAEAMMARIADDLGVPCPQLSAGALARLRSYHFPGNVRELENVLERAMALHEGSALDADDLQFSEAPRAASEPAATESPAPEAASRAMAREAPLGEVGGDLQGYLEDIERNVLLAALEQNRWNRTETARSLGVSFRSLRYRLKKLGLNAD